MSIEQSSPLVLITNEGRTITLNTGELRYTGDAILLKKPNFDEDDEIWSVTFDGITPYGKVKIGVSYSSSVRGIRIQDVSITQLPHGLDVEDIPTFTYT